MNKTIAIIQARCGSTRLPSKVLTPINGRPVLSHVVRRVQAVNVLKPGLLDKVVVATTTNVIDNLIEAWCQQVGVECFRGDEQNVLERYYRCAMKYKAEWVLRVTSDCPFVDPVFLAALLCVSPRKDYQALAINQRRLPDGYDGELFSFDELERVYKRRGTDEHVSTHMRKANEDQLDYGIKGFDFTPFKLSLDTESDYKHLQEYARYL